MLHAVVIGIDQYHDQAIPDLRWARADAEAFGGLLERGLAPRDRHVDLLLDERATRRNILVAIGEDLPRLTRPGDVVALYFAGHGSPEATGEVDEISRYLVAHDTEYDNVFATGIDLERELNGLFLRLRHPRLVALFLDACFSGGAGGRTFEGPRLHRTRARVRGARVSLAHLDLGEGRLMISACDEDQVAREDDQLGHGIFTHYLLRALTTTQAGEPLIGLHTLYETVAAAVRSHSRGRQVPVINGRSKYARFPLLGG